MKFLRSKATRAPVDPAAERVDRRSVVVGAGVATVAAVAAAAWQRAPAEAAPAAPDLQAREEPQGYRETAHVLRYYETTRA